LPRFKLLYSFLRIKLRPEIFDDENGPIHLVVANIFHWNFNMVSYSIAPFLSENKAMEYISCFSVKWATQRFVKTDKAGKASKFNTFGNIWRNELFIDGHFTLRSHSSLNWLPKGSTIREKSRNYCSIYMTGHVPFYWSICTSVKIKGQQEHTVTVR